MLKNIMMLVTVVLLISGLFGCEKEGPAERAGKKADKMFEDIKDRVEEAAK